MRINRAKRYRTKVNNKFRSDEKWGVQYKIYRIGGKEKQFNDAAIENYDANA